MMLAAQTLPQLMRQWDCGNLASVPEDLVRDRVPIVLTQILVRTLQDQEIDGSWAQGACEITAYATLTLARIATLPWMELLTVYTLPAIEKGKQFLIKSHRRWQEPCYTWVEKVTYPSTLLAQAYCLAALNVLPPPLSRTTNMHDLLPIPSKSVTEFAKFFSRLPLFSQGQGRDWQITASLLESYMFLPQLRRTKSDIFPQNEETESEYLEYIPFTWTSCNNFGNQTGSTILLDMMIISILNYQVDEYMEAIVARYHGHDLQLVKDIINRLCHASDSTRSVEQGSGSMEQGLATPPETDSDEPVIPSLAEVEKVLARFVAFVLRHAKVTQSPLSAQKRLEQELATFLLAHVTQIEDNTRFSQEYLSLHVSACYRSPRGTYLDWARTTSADHTSCPYSFVFFSCLISKAGQEAFTTAKQKYLAQDACRHLATMCRQYNDYGSVRRDFDEKNLNSVNFPEFRSGDCSIGEREDKIKADLLWLAEYERGCLEMTLQRLGNEVQEDVMDALRLFVSVTDLYGQIYVARDVSVRVK